MHEEPKIKCHNLQTRTPVCLKYKSVSLKTNYHHVSLFPVFCELYINALKNDTDLFLCLYFTENVVLFHCNDRLVNAS